MIKELFLRNNLSKKEIDSRIACQVREIQRKLSLAQRNNQRE